MKIASIMKRKKLLLLVAFAYLGVFLVSPDKAAAAVGNSVYYLVEMLQVLPVIFLLTVAIEALVPRNVIVRRFGEKSGVTGKLLALLLGSLSAGPIYAAFPVSKMLLGKGASIPNIVIILSAWAVIKVPMLVNEAKFLGVRFMVVRWALTVAAIFAMASIAGRLVRKEDIPTGTTTEPGTLVLQEGYCVGCGLCAKLFPEYYKMKDGKAVIRKNPDGPQALQAIRQSVERCPASAIILHTGSAS